jgi:hypothetical protein
MLKRTLLVVLVLASPVFAAPPAAISHPTAMLLAKISNGKKITFRAQTAGERFFFEEPAGVTVYTYDGKGYQREAFLKGTTLAQAMKRYAKKR